jgi:hypothetical protein
MKRKWREILAEWKKRSRKGAPISKDEFPRQLKRLHDTLRENQAQNLISSFRATGIVPLSKDAIL